MESLAFLGILIPLVGIGVVVLFIVAVMQQSKMEHAGGFKQAFFTVVSLVMLAITVGSLVAILSTTFRQTIFTQARSPYGRFGEPPPALYLPGAPMKEAQAVAYTCKEKCQFTADDKAQFASWKDQYKQWRDNRQQSNQQFRNDLVGPLSFLIVGLPLYLVFARLMERGGKRELDQLKKPAPLRSLYYYFVAFSGLLMVVFAAGWIINTVLRVVLRAEDPYGGVTRPVASESDRGTESIVNCASKCGFSADEVRLVRQWQSDQKTFEERTNNKTVQIHSDLSTQLPLLLVGLPLFWAHFARIRRESQESKPPAAPTPAVS
ncbi:MAG: hypothetical protein HYY50_03895 [Candidatus Kerfeldbacteria bacterium]|nr:hypothetical protein [Candidatus Kerfeldbacteria bacterium]